MMLHQYMVTNTPLLMTTAKLTLVLMKLVMATRQPDHTVLHFPMAELKLSTTMSMMLMVDTLLMSLMKDMPLTPLPQFTSQLINQLQFTTQLQSSLSMPKSSPYFIDANAYLLKLIYETIINTSILETFCYDAFFTHRIGD